MLIFVGPLYVVLCVYHVFYVNNEIKQHAVIQARRLSRFRDGRSSPPPGSSPPPPTHTVHFAFCKLSNGAVWRLSLWYGLTRLAVCGVDLPWGSVRIGQVREWIGRDLTTCDNISSEDLNDADDLLA